MLTDKKDAIHVKYFLSGMIFGVLAVESNYVANLKMENTRENFLHKKSKLSKYPKLYKQYYSSNMH